MGFAIKRVYNKFGIRVSRFGAGRDETESPCSRLVILVELCGDFLYSWSSMVVIEGVNDAFSWLCPILGQEIL